MGPLLLLLGVLLLCTSLEGSLRLSPDQAQFFRASVLTMRCDDSSWTMMRNTSRDTRRQCEMPWGMVSGSWCKLKSLQSRDTGRYWCESGHGQTSDSVHITVKDSGVILQVPVQPVTAGQTVYLSCQHQTSSNLPARFHKDGHFLSEQPTGRMTLQQVSASDEGLYQCEIRGETSETSRLRVTKVLVKPTSASAPPPSPPPSSSTAPPSSQSFLFLLPLVWSSVGLVVLVLLVLLVLLVKRCRCSKTKGARGKRRRRQGRKPHAAPQQPQRKA